MSSSATIRDGIGVFHKVYTDDYCDKLIRYYDMRRSIGGGDFARRTNNIVTDEAVCIGEDKNLDVFNSAVVDGDSAPTLLQDFNYVFWEHVYKPYLNRYTILNHVSRHRLGTLKLQQTRPTEGYHMWHCEQGDLNTARRLGFVILYLNDVHDGGETEFLHQAMRIQPVKGTMVIAPASFTHAHRGNPPLTEDKFIATTWIEFVE